MVHQYAGPQPVDDVPMAFPLGGGFVMEPVLDGAGGAVDFVGDGPD
jgi:hypothetical protein